jgi:hypothetical protein
MEMVLVSLIISYTIIQIFRKKNLRNANTYFCKGRKQSIILQIRELNFQLGWDF